MTTWLAGCVDDGLVAYDCALFPPAADSPYILPWSIGTTHRAIPHAAKTTPTGPQKYSIDVLMPIGTPILAMRDGVVIFVEESFVDGDNVPRHENYVFVEHEDGTVARYVHLTYGGVVFGVGDRVRQGEIIGYSGHTGNSTEPHLHIHAVLPESGKGVPITFAGRFPVRNRTFVNQE